MAACKKLTLLNFFVFSIDFLLWLTEVVLNFLFFPLCAFSVLKRAWSVIVQRASIFTNPFVFVSSRLSKSSFLDPEVAQCRNAKSWVAVKMTMGTFKVK